jgi:hypothetical protein
MHTIVSALSKYSKRLFADNAKVWNDLAEEPTYIQAVDYAGSVYDYLRKEGVITKFDVDYTFRVISEKGAGWKRRYDKIDTTGNTFFYEIAINKTTYNGIGDNKQKLFYPKGRVFELVLVLSISANPRHARILGVRPRKKQNY